MQNQEIEFELCHDGLCDQTRQIQFQLRKN